MDRFSTWVERYLVAWRSNDPDEIGSLFNDDALYLTLPVREPWRGRATIAKEWLARKDEPGDWEFSYEVLARDGDLGIVRGVTDYKSGVSDSGKEGGTFDNLWEVTLDSDDRAARFVEW
jgi:ketosteroid isomerase-like protein